MKNKINKSNIIAWIGPLVTILTLGGTMLYTQGGIAEKIESNKENVEENRKKIMTNRNKTQEIEIQQSSIESKLDLLITMMEDM